MSMKNAPKKIDPRVGLMILGFGVVALIAGVALYFSSNKIVGVALLAVGLSDLAIGMMVYKKVASSS